MNRLPLGSRPGDRSELFDLFDRMGDGTASAEQVRQLEGLLRTDGGKVSLFIRFMFLHALLERNFEIVRPDGVCPLPGVVPPPLTTEPTPFPSGNLLSTSFHGTVGYFSSGWPMAYLAATAILAIGLLIGSLVHVSEPVQIAGQSVLPSGHRPEGLVGGRGAGGEGTEKVTHPRPTVGRITGMVDCRWDKGLEIRDQRSGDNFHPSSLIPHPSSLVSLGDKFSLASGLMEITYNTGAKVILQGPITYEVESPAGGFLSLGKLTARVENAKQQAAISKSPNLQISKLFVVKTPTATVTDLGTEFGIEVGRDGACGVRVLQGLVVVATGPADGPAKSNRLRAGQAVRVERVVKGGAVRIVSIAPDAMPLFVRGLCSAESASYTTTVLADKPRFYWTFDEPTDAAFEQIRHRTNHRLLPAGGATRCAHATIGSGLALGRAADFTRSAGCFRSWIMNQDEMPGAWAIEFWLQITNKSAGGSDQCLLIAGEESGHDPYNPAILVRSRDGSPDSEITLIANGQRTAGGLHITDDRWHHVILVFYGNGEGFGVADRVDGIINGVQHAIARGKFSSGFALEGRVSVGAMTDDLTSPFRGRIDELAFYDLSGLSVQKIEKRAADMAKRHIAAAQRIPTDRPTAKSDRKAVSKSGGTDERN